MTDLDGVLNKALQSDPDEVLRLLDRIDAEESLMGFVKLMWPVLEPGRRLATGWAMEAICEHLEAITSGEIKRLLINVPPGTAKSTLTSVFWPAWEWGPKKRATLRYLCASYSEKLTIRDNRKFRALIKSEVFKALWGDQFDISSDQDAKEKLENTKMGFKIATSVGGRVTGERGDRTILDDPHNVKEAESEVVREATLQWFAESWQTRVNDEDSAKLIIMQRVHDRDVSGLVLASDIGYTHLCLPMRYEGAHPHRWIRDPRTEEGQLLWPERFPEADVDETEKAMATWGGQYAIAGQMQQRPVPRGGGMFKRAHARYVEKSEGGASCRGWDLAGSTKKRAKYTSGVKMTRTFDGAIIIEDVIRFKGTPMEVKSGIVGAGSLDGDYTRISIPQDPGQAGLAQKGDFARALHGYDIRFSLESGSKETRAMPMAAQWEAGNIYLVRAEWNAPFLAELCLFPYGEFSDQVDAASRAYAELLKMDLPSDSGFGAPTCFVG